MKFPLVEMFCELVFGVDVFDLYFGVQINSIEQPIKSNSVNSGNMTHCWTSAFNDHLDYSFICPQTHTIKLLDAKTRTFEGTESMSFITSILL